LALAILSLRKIGLEMSLFFDADSNYISYILQLYLKQLFAAINVAFALKK